MKAALKDITALESTLPRLDDGDRILSEQQFAAGTPDRQKDATMAVTFLIKFDVIPEQRARFLELLEGVLDAMRDEPMFHEAILHQDPESEHRFMLYETWEDFDDVVNVQLKRPYREAWHEALPTLLTKDRDITLWTPMRGDRAQP